MIAERRDMRRFVPGGVVSEDVLARLLHAAHAAPSVGLMQPWRFIRITDETLKRRIHALVDARWDGPQAGAATAEISPTGLQLDLDVADVDPKFSGQLALHFKATIGEDVLSRLPRRSLAFDVPAEYVNLAVGVTYSP